MDTHMISLAKHDIRVGPAGWHYKDWYGNVYPSKPSKSFVELEYMANYFNTVEINSTYYYPAAAQTAENWVRRVDHNPKFKFTAKLWRRFTHHRTSYTQKEVVQVREGFEPLMEAGVLGAVLIQFPWSFKCENNNKIWLAKLIKTFHGYPLVVEVRHASWDQNRFYDYLNQQQVGIAAIDQPLIGKSISLKPVQTGAIGYVRMHGRNYKAWFPSKIKDQNDPPSSSARYDYMYAESEVVEISKIVKQVAKKARETYVVQNNHPNGQAVANAAQLLSELGYENVQMPASILKAFPDLL